MKNLKDARIVIPNKKHDAVLKIIHEGYLGLNKCNQHAKDSVYWPCLNDQQEKNDLELGTLLEVFPI